MIRFTKSALADIDEAISWLAERNAAAANQLSERLRAGMERLAQFPDLGRSGRVAGTREWSVPETHYIAAYRITGGDVEILAIRHARRRWPDHFSGA